MSTPATSPRAPDLRGCALDGRYELHAMIGDGAFGRVYRGRDRRLARDVAVKVIKPWWAEDPEWVQGFEREAQLMARVSDPGIVQIFDVGYANEGLYYVAELVEGESLHQRLRRGPVTAKEACEVAVQLCRALGAAHAQRVVHRDVKPANVLISDRGEVKVGDFGMARLTEVSGDTLAATMAGTPRYMAPEQARGRGVSAATDVYSAGVVLYEMLAGRPPFTGGSAVEIALSHLSDPPPPLPPSTPCPLAQVVERALAKEPRERFADGRDMAEAIVKARPSGATEPARATAVSAAADSRPQPQPDPTRVAPRFSPPRTVNPAGRRRSIGALTSVLGLLLAMSAGAILIGGIRHVRVPDLRGLTRSTITKRARALNLRPQFTSRFSDAPRGAAIAQSPSPGSSVRDNSAVHVVLSAGPAPVTVPSVVGMPSAEAQSALQRIRLRASFQQVPAPGVSAGTVTAQAPGTGATRLPNSTVFLSVAEIPRWRTVTAFRGPERASVPFRVRGRRWRVVYGMGFQGTCTFIFFCSGPSAYAVNISNGTTERGFDLNEGSDQVHTFHSGPGVYELRVLPGSDTASWSVKIEDYY